MTRLETAIAAYFRVFNDLPPAPWGVSQERQVEVLEQAIADGKPLGDDFDYFADLPPDTVS